MQEFYRVGKTIICWPDLVTEELSLKIEGDG